MSVCPYVRLSLKISVTTKPIWFYSLGIIPIGPVVVLSYFLGGCDTPNPPKNSPGGCTEEKNKKVGNFIMFYGDVLTTPPPLPPCAQLRFDCLLESMNKNCTKLTFPYWRSVRQTDKPRLCIASLIIIDNTKYQKRSFNSDVLAETFWWILGLLMAGFKQLSGIFLPWFL